MPLLNRDFPSQRTTHRILTPVLLARTQIQTRMLYYVQKPSQL